VSVRWTVEAKQQLIDIKNYIANDDPVAADRQIKRLIARAETLGNPPLLGRVVPEIDRANIRELLERPYRIIYTMIDQQAWVLTVWHYRRLLKSADVAGSSSLRE
jgi:toxin ParE1/3/4